jgi:hypothetical protein
MQRSRLVSPVLALAVVLANTALAHAGQPTAQAVGLKIEDFSYLDTSGEPTDQTATHRMRLQQFMKALRDDVGADDRYHLVAAGAPPPTTDEPARSGRGILITGAIQKMSTLVQWASVRAIDIDANRVVLDKRYSFRGDSDEAWRRAEAFVSEDIRATLAPSRPIVAAAAPTQINVAVFDFELEDSSAAISQIPSDATELANTTDAIRQLLTRSGRYRVVAASGHADAAKTPPLHDCAGCDAGIALSLGADQSLVGVIRRISRTEYAIRFQLRDARTSGIIAAGDSGLRMGANYSWSRGAVRLIRDRLLELQPPQ